MATRHIGPIVTGCLIGGLVAALAVPTSDESRSATTMASSATTAAATSTTVMASLPRRTGLGGAVGWSCVMDAYSTRVH